jgi:hypothetical protein
MCSCMVSNMIKPCSVMARKKGEATPRKLNNSLPYF